MHTRAWSSSHLSGWQMNVTIYHRGRAMVTEVRMLCQVPKFERPLHAVANVCGYSATAFQLPDNLGASRVGHSVS